MRVRRPASRRGSLRRERFRTPSGQPYTGIALAALTWRLDPCRKGESAMIKLAGIGHVLLRVADEEASKRFYRDVLGFQVAEQDPEHGGVFMTLGDGFHTIDVPQHPAGGE